MYIRTNSGFGQVTSLPELPSPDTLACLTRVLTYEEVMDERISVPAQHSLVRLSKNPATRRAACEMLYEVKSKRLAGIYCVNAKKPALRARRFGEYWWTVIPKGEDAIVMPDPIMIPIVPAILDLGLDILKLNPNILFGLIPNILKLIPNILNLEPPLIAFRRELDTRPKVGCGRLPNEKPSPPKPQKLDDALLKAWATYRQSDKIKVCLGLSGDTVSITNIVLPGLPKICLPRPF